jgi:hypothetical protein
MPMGRLRSGGIILLGMALSACYVGTSGTADSGTGDSDGVTGGDPSGSGDSGDPADLPGDLCGEASPEVTSLKRLSVAQYENTLRDLLADVPSVFDTVAPLAAALPVDGGETTFSNMDNRLAARHIDTWFAVATTVGDAMLDDPAVMSAIAGQCASAPEIDDQCLETFVSEFGLRVHRHPLSEEEVDGYLSLVTADRTGPENYRDIAVTMLMGPRFVYHFEVDGAPAVDQADLLVLDGYEVASRLSYHFWQSMPDDALFAAAADGSLNTDAGYQAQVDRILASDRTRETTEDFYREWFIPREFGGIADTPAFQTFSEGLGTFAGDPEEVGDALQLAMDAELDALTSYYTFEQGGQLSDLLTSNLSFTNSPLLAELYGVEPWDGTGQPPQFADGERAGVHTRAANLVTGDHTTNPIHRGIDIQERLLCAHIPPPPADLPADAFDPPPLDPTKTTRERIDDKTADAQCVACHQLINPFGHALEAYDGLGRYRVTERVIDGNGDVLAELPVDASATLLGLGDNPEVSGPVELAEVVAGDSAYLHCFAKHYFEFTYRREPTDAGSDACVMEEIESRAGDGTIRSALAEIALQTEFRIRGVE